MTPTITQQQQDAIACLLKDCHLPKGLGKDKHEACSIVAINLALTGKLTDDIPDCMSEVIGRWIIRIQDAMPDEMRNSPEWKSLLPMAAGTGRDHEKQRFDLIMDWMGGTVLPQLQPLADDKGFGKEWKRMTDERTEDAAYAAARAADNAYAYAADNAAAYAADNAYAAAAARAADNAAARAADNAARAAAYAAVAPRKYVDADYWQAVNPPALLRKLIYLETK